MKDYPFRPQYFIHLGLKMHYLDEGPKGSIPVLLLHGVPSWSYIYRKIIPVLSGAGFRVIAPDLVGFGKSDKPDNRGWHSLQKHVDYIDGLIQHLDISDIVLFGHDWGSMIGLREAASKPEKFSGIIISNGGLPEGDEKVPWQFMLWKLFARFSPFFPAGRIIEAGSLNSLTPDEKKAYKSPFPAGRHKKGPRTLPGLVSLKYYHPDSAANREAWAVLRQWRKPFLTVFGDSDPITRGFQKKLIENIPGAAGQDHRIIHAGHFIQEDAGAELAKIIVDFINNNLAGFRILNPPDELENSI